MQLRDYQQLAVDHAVCALLDGRNTCYAAPTGSGKSYIELAVQSRFPGAWIITPKMEIIAGLLNKTGVSVPDADRALIDLALLHRITTPTRLRNMLLAGEIPAPDQLIIDEGHHDVAETYQQIHALCCCPAILYTASPYRGTPKGTAVFRECWGEPVWILTYAEAADRGVVSVPSIKITPLVDDDFLEISGGEFTINQLTSATHDKIHSLVDLARDYYTDHWNKPTMWSCPTRDVAYSLANELNKAGLPSVSVTGDSDYEHRKTAFAQCLAKTHSMLQIYVISEGIDLPIERLIDISPTLSPVKWIQQFGRIMRPGLQSEYICTNRNFLRHHYLLEGCLPITATKDAIDAFGGLGGRLAVRAMGLEPLGRLNPVTLPLMNGLFATCYSIFALRDSVCTEYFIIIEPHKEEVFWACRRNETAGDTRVYGTWRRCEQPDELKGFKSLATRKLSDKQLAWWKRSAARVGLNPAADISRKEFPALPVLLDTGYRL